MQCALLGLIANGYRPSTTTPGHHQTMIRSLGLTGLTLGASNQVWVVLEALRKKRNLNDYSGDLIEPGTVRTCVTQAAALLFATLAWLRQHRPELVPRKE